MSSIAAALRVEILRVARKEIRIQMEAIRKTNARLRRDVALLKSQVKALERAGGKARRAAPVEPTQAASDSPRRFSAKGLRSHRLRLGLSLQDTGRLLGVSGQSVQNWESMKAAPRPLQIDAIASLRSMGKRAAQERLASLG
jgi:DNA-binding transcriptional regulator YiaG